MKNSLKCHGKTSVRSLILVWRELCTSYILYTKYSEGRSRYVVLNLCMLTTYGYSTSCQQPLNRRNHSPPNDQRPPLWSIDRWKKKAPNIASYYYFHWPCNYSFRKWWRERGTVQSRHHSLAAALLHLQQTETKRESALYCLNLVALAHTIGREN